MNSWRSSSLSPFSGFSRFSSMPGHDAELGLALLVRHRAAAGADLRGVAEHLLELVLRERHLVAVELRRLAREQLDRACRRATRT